MWPEKEKTLPFSDILYAFFKFAHDMDSKPFRAHSDKDWENKHGGKDEKKGKAKAKQKAAPKKVTKKEQKRQKYLAVLLRHGSLVKKKGRLIFFGAIRMH